MSDSVATATPRQEPSLKSVSYADDFHSPSRQSSVADEDSLVDSPEAPRVSFRYRDRVRRRSICVYNWRDCANDEQEDDRSAPVEGRPRHSARSRLQSAGGSVSYSSTFDATADTEKSTSSSSNEEEDEKKKESGSSSSTVGSGASYLRVMSIDQLTTAEDRFLEVAFERLTRTLTSSPAPMPLPPAPSVEKSVESTARALLRSLRQREGATSHWQGGSPPGSSANPYLQLAAAGTPATAAVAIPRLTVEQLRVESLRLGARLLTGAELHEPRACPECRRERERLARADWLRGLTVRARSDTVERRLLDHLTACVVSRQMLNVGRNARLVSDWLRTGRVPEMRGVS